MTNIHGIDENAPYEAEYAVWEEDKDDERGSVDDPYECFVSNYQSIEILKAKSAEIVLKVLQSHSASDGRIHVSLVITNAFDEFAGSDQFDFQYEHGKIRLLYA